MKPGSWKISFTLTAAQARAFKSYLYSVVLLGPDTDDPDVDIVLFKLQDHLEAVIHDSETE